MFALILSYLAKPKVAGTIAVILALLAAFTWYGAKREASGFASGSRAQLETDKAQFTQLADQYKQTLSTAQAHIDASDAHILVLDGQLKVVEGQLVTLATQRQQSATQVSQIPDSEVKTDIETKVGGSLDSTSILRKIDAIVTDYPLVLKQVDVLTDDVKKLNEKTSELNTKTSALETQVKAAVDYGNTVTGYYVKAYNAAQVHHSKLLKVITFGLVHDKHLDLPKPEALKP